MVTGEATWRLLLQAFHCHPLQCIAEERSFRMEGDKLKAASSVSVIFKILPAEHERGKKHVHCATLV